MKKLDELKKKRDTLNREIRDIEEKELEEKLLPQLKKQIGDCYVFVNSYGGSSPTWYLYYRVTGVNDDASFTVDSFQITGYGTIEIEHGKVLHNFRDDTFNDRSYKKITIEEYQKAQRDLLEFVKKVLL